MRFLEELMPGLRIYEHFHDSDARGSFSKLYSQEAIPESLFGNPMETFLTKSKRDVIRGMHFQAGKAAHNKLVSCVRGSAIDVVVCNDRKSRHYGSVSSLRIEEGDNIVLLVGQGLAHGFLSLEDETWINYITDHKHVPSLDQGVLWSSIDFRWPCIKPIISERDAKLPTFGIR